jgi:hypothetical protein
MLTPEMLLAILANIAMWVVVTQHWPAPKLKRRPRFVLGLPDGQGFTVAHADINIVRVVECWHDPNTGAEITRHVYGARLRPRRIPRRA